MTPPNSGEHDVTCLCESRPCKHEIAAVSVRVSLPLHLAQRILAALEAEAGAEDNLDRPSRVYRELAALAAELRDRMGLKP